MLTPLMTLETQPGQSRLEGIVELAKEVALRDGGHVPTLIIEGTGESVITQVPWLPDTPEHKQHMMREIGGAAAQTGRVGSLQTVFFIAEGWMSAAPPGGEPAVPPSQDPNRKEILQISSLQVESHKSEIVMFEMVRDGQRQLVELKRFDMGEGTEGSAPILDAFVEGFVMTRRAKLN